MFNIKLKRPVVTVAVLAGILAAASPAGAQGRGADFTRLHDVPIIKAPALAQPFPTGELGLARMTMLDYEGSPVVTYARDGSRGKMHLEDVSLGVTVDAGSGDDKLLAPGDGGL